MYFINKFKTNFIQKVTHYHPVRAKFLKYMRAEVVIINFYSDPIYLV